MNSHRLYRISLSASVLGLIMAVASFAFPAVPVGMLSFYFPICWALWIGCVVVGQGQSLLRLLGLWVSIDIAILAMFLSINHSLGNINGSPGTDIVWAICYGPMLLPTGLIASYLFPLFSVDHLTNSTDSSLHVIINTWIEFSILAATQALIIALLTQCIRTFWSKRKQQFQVPEKFT